MIHLRIVAPVDLAEQALEVLQRTPSVTGIVHLHDAVTRPDGDLILGYVPREDASVVIEELRRCGLEQRGAIFVEEMTAVSDHARRAEKLAAGAPADAVVWEEVEARTSESSELSGSFVSFMVLATLIAAVGILTDSLILIIGAMVVGPEFGPLAGVCVAAVQRRSDLARRSLLALAVGFPAAILAALVGTLLLDAAGKAPGQLTAQSHPATLFISSPNVYSIVVALLAGVAGMLSLSTAKSGALIGVLISVTTIPAAANVGVAAAYGDWDEVRGAAGQLAINLACIVLAGIATLTLQRRFFSRRRRLHAARQAGRRPKAS
jgi:uncharacterized hydrophobic protein (TIGR00271 family)